MSEADRPFRAFPYAPHCTMPTPWPHPRPVTTRALSVEDRCSHRDGIVRGRVPFGVSGGYRPGRRHGAHVLTASRRSAASIERIAPPPRTVREGPRGRATEIARPRGQSPAARRNRVRWPNGNRTRQRAVGDAPSSLSLTDRRYGRGELPN